MAPFTGFSVIAQTPQPTPPADPTVMQSGEDIIYIGIGLIAVTIVLIVGLLSRRLGAAIVFALILSFVIALLVVIT
jgi:hypothetical protein